MGSARRPRARTERLSCSRTAAARSSGVGMATRSERNWSARPAPSQSCAHPARPRRPGPATWGPDSVSARGGAPGGCAIGRRRRVPGMPAWRNCVREGWLARRPRRLATAAAGLIVHGRARTGASASSERARGARGRWMKKKKENYLGGARPWRCVRRGAPRRGKGDAGGGGRQWSARKCTGKKYRRMVQQLARRRAWSGHFLV